MGWQELTVSSDALRGNPLGDPHERPLFVWTPPNYDAEPDRQFPSIYLLHSMTGQARSWFNVSPFAPGFADEVDALGLEAVIVVVDGFTALGGAQWIDSAAIGDYGRYLCEDVVEFVDDTFRTFPKAGHRGIAGKSSGGFGAMTWALLRPDLFGGVATHAGDALFDVTLAAEFAPAAQTLRNLYDSSFDLFWDDFRSGRPVLENRTDPLLQNVWAVSAAFSTSADGTVSLPFHIDTGAIVPEVFEHWLARDPVRLAASHGETLAALRAIWIDAGRNDEYYLDLGAVAFHEAVLSAGVLPASLRFELFDGGHRGLNRRFLLSLPFLASRLI
ncbi:MAG TPA: alpha/beta hydrolase-fold protein [Gaiellaceae bacterium]|jgi:hypothetical protein|nr:alpha/beta hydrolase-fold protein [Gaiellaceae bacterium]